MVLHGLAGTGDEFTATAAAVGPPFRFVLPDLRGHGASTRRPDDLSRAAFVEDVAAVIGQVSPGRPVTLAGQSMGGHTAILAAAAALEFLGDSALSRARAARLEPGTGGGLVPPFAAGVMQAVMEGVAEPQWEQWPPVPGPAT